MADTILTTINGMTTNFDHLLSSSMGASIENAPAFKRFSDFISDGTYLGTLFKVGVGQTRTGDPSLWANFEVIRQAELDTFKEPPVLVRQMTLSERAAPFFAADLRALNVKVTSFAELFSNPEEHLVGITAKLEVTNTFSPEYNTWNTRCRILGVVDDSAHSIEGEPVDFEM